MDIVMVVYMLTSDYEHKEIEEMYDNNKINIGIYFWWQLYLINAYQIVHSFLR